MTQSQALVETAVCSSQVGCVSYSVSLSQGCLHTAGMVLWRSVSFLFRKQHFFFLQKTHTHRYAHIYKDTHMHVCKEYKHAHTNTPVFSHTHTQMHTRIKRHTHTHVHARIQTCTHKHIHTGHNYRWTSLDVISDSDILALHFLLPPVVSSLQYTSDVSEATGRALPHWKQGIWFEPLEAVP